MPHYKLYYFNGRGRAELARLIFAAAGHSFEDIRYEQAEWQAHKPEFPFGVLPVLEVDGEKIGQSAAIAHYLAKQLGLAGDNDLHAFKAQAIVETVRDFVEPAARIFWQEKDPVRKQEQTEEYKEKTLKGFLDKLEKHLAENVESSGYFVAHKLTYADLAFYNGMHFVNSFLGSTPLTAYPHLLKNYQATEAHPQIAEYLSKRPHTPF